MICALVFQSVLGSSTSEIADQLVFRQFTCPGQLTLQGQEQDSCLQEWQGHDGSLVLQLVFKKHLIKAHWAHCAAQYNIGEVHANPKSQYCLGFTKILLTMPRHRMAPPLICHPQADKLISAV